MKNWCIWNEIIIKILLNCLFSFDWICDNDKTEKYYSVQKRIYQYFATSIIKRKERFNW
jgi:hypothetical protein